ncbi:hypothetical protein PSACC_01421 [Paramicrosporidium saccamoebae]|uniref:Uncharacterized protein n=1 Tax=Paramicrosporidium saccamoebae TaxID=1246581 RepID=A0A2H9TLY5_9FUNG|nr:hypothetical protein PSACC_01421 [Paramicrosporidium saccamoebae]
MSRLYNVLLYVLALTSYCRASSDRNTPIVGHSELIARGEGLSLFSLNIELGKAMNQDGLSVSDACLIALKSQAAQMNFRAAIKEALREEYTHLLRSVQSDSFPLWQFEENYHFLFALSFKMSWWDEKLWEGRVFNWKRHYLEILKADGVKFFKHAKINQLIPPELYTENAELQKLLESLDAVEIMKHLKMNIRGNTVSIKELIVLGHVNTLRLLVHSHLDVSKMPSISSIITSPDIVDIILPVKPDIVNLKKLLCCALRFDQVDMIQVLYRHLGTKLLHQKLVNAAIDKNARNILRWVQTVDPNFQLARVPLTKLDLFSLR